jgi:hypothetical protein
VRLCDNLGFTLEVAGNILGGEPADPAPSQSKHLKPSNVLTIKVWWSHDCLWERSGAGAVLVFRRSTIFVDVNAGGRSHIPFLDCVLRFGLES